MIDSAVFSRNTILEVSQEWKTELGDSQKLVNKSTLYHLIMSFVSMISQETSLLKVEKAQVVQDFGYNIGKNIAEEESLGNIKYFIVKGQKDKSRAFLGQFKFLSLKIWPVIFGSTSKLFAVVGEGGGYKLEDKDFGLIKWLSGDQEKLKSLKRLLFDFSRGVLQGFLDKFQLSGEVSYSQVTDSNINFEVKNLGKKVKTSFK